MLLPHASQATRLLSSSTRRCAASVTNSLCSMQTVARSSSQPTTASAAAESAAAGGLPETTTISSSNDSSSDHATASDQPAAVKKVKRNVALHVGYVGTAYTGLQANRELPHLATIEGVLEKAMLDAGLIAEVNFGDFRKTKWSRSSRTDKGVHSLCTVIGLRILMDDQTYHTDPEGIAYARAINQHLPQDIRVFAVQRTNKSFNARRWCGSRTYEYYLPAAMLGLETADASSQEDQRKLAMLREVLGLYVGYKPFQNYAGNRRQYVGQKAKAARRKARRAAREAEEAATAAAATTDAGAESSSPAADSTPPAEQQQTHGAAASSDDVITSGTVSSSTTCTADSTATATTSTTAEESEESEGMDPEEVAQYEAAVNWEYSGEGPVPPELLFRQQVRFLTAPEPDDPVVKSHYRMIRSFTADDPRPLVQGGVPCLRLEVCGDSFMLHQIRHMVGTAVAVARGIMPRELVEVSLSAPGRVTLPRAPPHTLLLSGSLFSPFPTGWGHETPLVARWTGERLRLREGGQQELLEFRQRVFDPALNNLLQHPDWDTWSRKLLPRYCYAPEDVVPAVETHAVWYAELKAKRAAEAAVKAAAAAAAQETADKQDAKQAGPVDVEAPSQSSRKFGCTIM